MSNKVTALLLTLALGLFGFGIYRVIGVNKSDNPAIQEIVVTEAPTQAPVKAPSIKNPMIKAPNLNKIDNEDDGVEDETHGESDDEHNEDD